MRIHSDILSRTDVTNAARTALAYFDSLTEHGSRKRDHAFEVKLRGGSNRRPNFYNGSGDYAATWDQWGVFFSVLYDRDPNMVCGSAYSDREDFDLKTSGRFAAFFGSRDETGNYWPADAHGDHTFRYSGTPRQQECTKCSAVQRWL